MPSKKIVMSVSATAAIASAIFAAQEVEAASHKVERGDTLWSIAQKYNTTVAQLKSANGLSEDIIYPNQIIKTKKKSSTDTTAKTTDATNKANTYTVKRGDTLSEIAYEHNISISDLMKWNDLDTTLIFPGNELYVEKPRSKSSGHASSGSASAEKVYTVKSGDSLWTIASRHNVSVDNLKKWNNLTSDRISIGQKLHIGQKAASNSGADNSSNEKPTADVSYNVDKLIRTAKSMQGVNYVWGGSSPSGFDCSGFIYYTYNQAGMSISRLSTEGYYNRSHYVNHPQVGDLVFFEGTYKPGISHMGIYLGDNQFIHAGSDGVEISNLNNGYWQKHYDGFKRFY